jgi:3,4-dihydroxy-2-butanone 4-phosphate synthase
MPEQAYPTGVSAEDRTKTILTLASPDSKPSDLRRPGHIFPLKYRNGGVLKRVGHTEASVDLVALADQRPVSVLSTVLDLKDGSVAGITILQQMALEHNIPIISIADLIRLVYLKVKPLGTYSLLRSALMSTHRELIKIKQIDGVLFETKINADK